MSKRVFLIVLDSFGIGAAPDAKQFGDIGSNTLGSISKSADFFVPNMIKLGLGNIDCIDCIDKVENPIGAYGKMQEVSCGKDTTTGHWEIAGVISRSPMPTYPNGFPNEIIKEFEYRIGRECICNLPYSGTKVIADYGEEHLKSEKIIVYTSADSVFQIAAHTDIVTLEKLYEYCRIARKILVGKHGVGRVIARPFAGNYPNFYRTEDRRDFSLVPYCDTILDKMKEQKYDVIAIGKIADIFATKGITKSILTHNNKEGMLNTSSAAKEDFNGLCFVNLVDFDMLYGHRNDVDGYASALSSFDTWLGEFISEMKEKDVLIITGDHGCDPGDASTDHTREYVPLLIYGKNINPIPLGTMISFSNVSSIISDIFSLNYKCEGIIPSNLFLE